MALSRAIRTQLIEPLQDYITNWREYLHLCVELGGGIVHLLMCFKVFAMCCGVEWPAVTVLSGSMDPTLSRGDALILYQPYEFTTGDIIVFVIKNKGIPIIHRVIETHRDESGKNIILTKGDHNRRHDAHGIYDHGQMWLKPEEILGKALVFIPGVGFPSIWLQETPGVKEIFIGIFVIVSLMTGE